jgi:hypothetical protein
LDEELIRHPEAGILCEASCFPYRYPALSIIGFAQKEKLRRSDPLEVAPAELPLILETRSYKQVVPYGTSSL